MHAVHVTAYNLSDKLCSRFALLQVHSSVLAVTVGTVFTAEVGHTPVTIGTRIMYRRSVQLALWAVAIWSLEVQDHVLLPPPPSLQRSWFYWLCWLGNHLRLSMKLAEFHHIFLWTVALDTLHHDVHWFRRAESAQISKGTRRRRGLVGNETSDHHHAHGSVTIIGTWSHAHGNAVLWSSHCDHVHV